MARKADGKGRKNPVATVASAAGSPNPSASDMEVIISRLSEISNRRKVEALDALVKLAPARGTPGSGRAAAKARLIAEDVDSSGDLLALLPTS